MPTAVLTPYWVNGIQKLKLVSQGGRKLRVVSSGYSINLFPIDSEPPARGFIPPELSANVHAARCLAQLRSKDKNIEKYIYLLQLKHADESMFYRLCLENMQVCFPIS